MNLPSSGITWKHYRNVTPTFDLTPVEKPDLSPFLIHMTGKNSLVSILKGENIPEGFELKDNNGFLKAIKPSFDGQAAYYNSEVVCFTESPIFALDFFRYRSFRRWSDNQQYGIGFFKRDLIAHRNVRPVIYLDSSTNSELLQFCNNIISDQFTVTDKDGVVKDKKDLFNRIKPLLFPLLEETTFQGFMWEREWRCPDEGGMTFPHNTVRIICCPAGERDEIIEVLGEHAAEVEIVESWREYDDVTNYLKRRQRETKSEVLNKISEIKDFAVLNDLKTQNERTLNTLEGYYDVFKETVSSLEGNNINGMIEEMKAKSKEIDSQIKAVLEERKKKEEQAQAKKKK
jgi:hypothetical protein